MAVEWPRLSYIIYTFSQFFYNSYQHSFALLLCSAVKDVTSLHYFQSMKREYLCTSTEKTMSGRGYINFNLTIYILETLHRPPPPMVYNLERPGFVIQGILL